MKYFCEIAALCFEMSSIFAIGCLVLLDIIYVNLSAKNLLKLDTAWTFIKILSILDDE